MSELKMISPLLDRMTVEKEGVAHGGRTCYTLRNTSTGERYILKRICVPASDSQVRAMILSGAYADEAAVHAYYGGMVGDIKAELEKGKGLAAAGNFAGAVAYQIEESASGVGFEIYILYPLYVPLADVVTGGAITNLRAINLGIDLCDALQTCREAGYLFGNLKPENVYLMPTGRFLLGDLGLVPLQDLKYACLPEEYIGAYAAPELSDITASPNTTIDLYSLGMVLYRVYNGNHGPFEDENTGEAMADKLRMSGKPLPTPMYADYELTGIILKACAFRKEDRYQSPEELKQALVLYMQRNEVSDTLLIPPIVAEPVTITEEMEEDLTEDEPMRMTDVEKLDENFRQSFAPDLSGAGTEDDIDPTIPVAVPVAAAPAQAVQETQLAEVPEEAPTAEEPPTPDETDAQAESAEPATEPIAEEAVQVEEAELLDPDQIDIDSLLASVNQIVGAEEAGEEEDVQTEDATEEDALPVEPHITHSYVDAEPEDVDTLPEALEGRSSKLVKGLTIAGLLLAIAGLCYFLLSWYFVDVDQLNMISRTPEQIVIELESDDAQDRFELSCTDGYGSARPMTVNGNRYTFSELEENTTYTITVAAASYHKLTSASTYTMNVTTPERTKITELEVARGNADGEVELTITHDGPTPDLWKLTYLDEEGHELGSKEFGGYTCRITGLELNQTYTFRLENSKDIWLIGETETTYTLLPIVEANELMISSINGSQVTLTWECGENIPPEWTVTCEAEGMEAITETTTETSHTLTLPDFDRDYVLSVKAAGMDKAESLDLPAEPIIVENLIATANEDGTVTITWDAPAGAPEDGWILSYNTVGSLHDPRYYPTGSDAAITDTSVTMADLIPNAEYELELVQTTQTIYGATKVKVKTAETVAFDEYNVSPTPALSAASGHISLWPLPAYERWDYTDLKDMRSYFNVREKIAVCLEVRAVNASAEQVTVLYVVRDADGNVVNDVPPTKLAWDDLWYSRHHASAIPMPARAGEDAIPGNYRLEIYVNGKLLAHASFEIIAAS